MLPSGKFEKQEMIMILTVDPYHFEKVESQTEAWFDEKNVPQIISGLHISELNTILDRR
jgi:pyrroline-5-carboxylate reductase